MSKSYRTEFPVSHWPTGYEVELIHAAGLADTSRRNNCAPSFSKSLSGDQLGEGLDVTLFTDAPHSAARENALGSRFVIAVEDCGDTVTITPDGINRFTELHYDELTDALEWVADYEQNMHNVITRA